MWEVAVAAFYLVPLREPEESARDVGSVGARLVAFLEGCRLRPEARARLADAVLAFHFHRYERARLAGRLTPAWEERHKGDTLWLRQLTRPGQPFL